MITNDWNLNEIHANYRNKVWHTLYPSIYVTKYYYGRLKFGWKIT